MLTVSRATPHHAWVIVSSVLWLGGGCGSAPSGAFPQADSARHTGKGGLAPLRNQGTSGTQAFGGGGIGATVLHDRVGAGNSAARPQPDGGSGTEAPADEPLDSAGTGGEVSIPPAAGAGAAGMDGVPVADPSDAVFDLTKLHTVRVDVASSDLDTLRNDRTARIAATVNVDGQPLSMIIAHRKGFTTGSASKPSLSLDFDDTVKNQKLFGMTKLILNNAKQDPSFLNEHLAYEFVRLAGLPAPRTAHAVVTINGVVEGLYILEEDLNKQYLARWFGSEFKSGNLYEGSLQDFVRNQTAGTWPNELDLKGEADEGRTRDDIQALAQLVESASDAKFESQLSTRFDFDSFITAFAADMITGNWDDYCYGSNNYYLYHNPQDDRFVLLLRGMDFLWTSEANFPTSKPDARIDPFVQLQSLMSGVGPGRIAARTRAIPRLETRLRAEVGKLVRTAWDVAHLRTRINQVATMLHTNTNRNATLLADIASFDAQRTVMYNLIADRQAYLKGVTPAP